MVKKTKEMAIRETHPVAVSSVKNVLRARNIVFLDVGSGCGDSVIVVRWEQECINWASDVENL